MRLRVWPYLFRQALNNIVNNKVVHGIGLGTMVVSLLIVGLFLLLFVNLDTWMQGWRHSLSMSVYLQDGISDAKRDTIAGFVKKLPGAEIKRYVSKDRALGDLRDALGAKAGLLDGLSDSPLPASFEVVFKEVDGQKRDPEGVKNRLEQLEGVEEVQYSEEWLHRFEDLMGMIRVVGFVVGGLLCIGVLFIVTNTIKLTIYSRKEEIEILKLVGATDWFVKIPFLLEGVAQGILSGVLALVVLFLGYFVLSVKKMHFLGLAMLDFVFLPYEYVLSIFFISLALGLMGSFVAVGRFFEV
ncbi:MAG: ABC transporter permease [Deltaproteobacteria bacterium]|nr:ABC transporter permease [Deltaproteobacteria bacterium]